MIDVILFRKQSLLLEFFLINASVKDHNLGYAILIREEFSCLINSHEQGHGQPDSGKLNTGGHK